MQNLFNYDALAQWWDLNMAHATKPYWVLHRSAGGKAAQVIAFYQHDEINVAWTALVETINNCIQQGIFEFAIVARKGGPNDTKNRVEYILRASGYSAAQGPYYPNGGIAGMGGGVQYPAAAAPDIGAIREEMERRFTLEKQLEIARIEHKHQMERMEEMIEGIARDKQSNFERFLETLNNPEVATGVIGLINSVKALLTPGAPVPSPNIGQVPPASSTHAPTGDIRKRGRPRKVTIVEEQASANELPLFPSSPEPESPDYDDDGNDYDTPDETPEIGQTPEFVPLPELENDYDASLTAVNLLHQAGWENPGELLLKVASFAVNNPRMAKQLIANL